MTRELRRLLISPRRLADAAGQGSSGADGAGIVLPIEPGEAHYLRRVLRLRQGDRLAVIDGRGRLWTAVGLAADRLRLEQPLAAPLEVSAPPAAPLTLALAVPKRDADRVWRMATELGADVLQPLLGDHCVSRQGQPLERWRSILREATEQCERLWLPRLEEPALARDWLTERRPGTTLFATTRRAGLPLMAELLGQGLRDPGAAITLAIGPEGGWSPAEEYAAEAGGWHAVSLGATILRSDTAAVAGIAQLAATRRLSCPSSPSPCP